MGDVGSLLVGVAALVSSLVSAGALLVSIRRGSDRESMSAAKIAVQVVRNAESPEGDSNVIVIDPEGRDASGR